MFKLYVCIFFVFVLCLYLFYYNKFSSNGTSFAVKLPYVSYFNDLKTGPFRICLSGIVGLKHIGNTSDGKNICSLDPGQQWIVEAKEYNCNEKSNFVKTTEEGICQFFFYGVKFKRKLSPAWRCTNSGSGYGATKNHFQIPNQALYVWIGLKKGCQIRTEYRQNGYGRTDSLFNNVVVLDASESFGTFGGYKPEFGKREVIWHPKDMILNERTMYDGFQHVILDYLGYMIGGDRVVGSQLNKSYDFLSKKPTQIETSLHKLAGFVKGRHAFVENQGKFRLCSERMIWVHFSMERQFLSSPEQFYWARHGLMINQRLHSGKRVVLYFSRAGFGRNVDNSREVISFIQSYLITNKLNLDFQVFSATKQSIQETFDLVQRADLLIGPHGGALANIIFAKNNATVIEFCGYNEHGSEEWKSYWYYGWNGLDRHICVKKQWISNSRANLNLQELRAALDCWRTNNCSGCNSAIDINNGKILVDIDSPQNKRNFVIPPAPLN